MDVKTTLCAYWDVLNETNKRRLDNTLFCTFATCFKVCFDDLKYLESSFIVIVFDIKCDR